MRTDGADETERRRLVELEAKLSEVESELASERERRQTLETRLETAQRDAKAGRRLASTLRSYVVGEYDTEYSVNEFDAMLNEQDSILARVDSLEMEVETVERNRERVLDERRLRGREDGRLARRLSTVEDEVGISPPEAVAVGEGGADAGELSRLERFLRYGPSAVVDQPYPVHYRAHEIGLHLGEWGMRISDANGRRIRLCSKRDDLKQKLEAKRDETLQWTQVYRAMEKLVKISEGKVRLRDGVKSEGRYVLEVRYDETG
ncbi:hypothetical protein [Haloprofundus salinisoli]|uniref:hypothetical protein n=1 Tax=Haloprofundus salinisoli TaxID=2876193 RepID=UPI001CC92F19|nr:hypothetical protein [Haloprofundus salinisoli]